MDKHYFFSNALIFSLMLTLVRSSGYADEYRWMAVGSLQNWFSDAGCEIEVGRRHLISDQQDGLKWPAQFKDQDMQVAKGLWIGTTNYTDPLQGGTVFPYKVVEVGPRVLDRENEFMPVSLKTIGKFVHPIVLVDGVEQYQMDQVDEIDPTLPTDRILVNVVNTSIGITLTRKVYASSAQSDDNYMIYEYVFKNTGIYDKNGSVQYQTLNNVVFFYQYRYGICKEAGVYGFGYAPQSVSWGHNTVNDILHPFYGDNIRAIYAWHGLHSKYDCDNIGGPNIGSDKITADGRLGAAQFPGVAVLHADKSVVDRSDDQMQPFSLPYFSSGMQLVTPNHNQFDASRMSLEYELMMRGIPSQTHAQAVGNQDADLWVATPSEGNFGGYTQSMGFGPYTIAPGDSIRIVLAEGVNGLSREKCEQIGGQWYQQSTPYIKPDGSVTSNRDEFKDAWVFTGKDSIRQTFNKALTVWQNGLNFEQSPPPPDLFEVISDSSQIVLNWSDNAESYTNFAGYRIFRSVGTNEGPYECIFECDKGSSIVNTYQDKTVEIQKDYYYYIVSYDDGTISTTSPGKVLESNLFWTRTDQPATLRSEPFIFGDVFISPNGNDGNSGLTPGQSFKTMANALNKIAGSKINQQTIHLSGGRYSIETTGETFPIIINKSVRIEGTTDNRAILDAQSSGGVISIASNIKVDLANLVITNGNSQYGGGIKAGDFSSIFLSGVSIINNQADCGSGIYFGNSTRIKFDPDKLSNIYNNQYGRFGSEIFGIHPDSIITVFVDTFTVRKPCDYLIYPCEMFSMDVRHSVIDQFTSDLYVAPEGDDSNIGTDSSAPLKTVRQAIIKSDPSAIKSIILSPGIYSPSTTGEVFPIRGFSNLIISGPENLQAILDPEQLGNGIYIDNDSNLTIKNLEIRNGEGLYGGAVYIINSRPNLENLHLIGNRAFDGGGGIACFNQAAPRLGNLTINNNQATYGGAIFFSGISEVKFDTLKLCNIYNNWAVFGSDLYAENCSNQIRVYLDTFTVYYLTEDYVFPLTSFDMRVNTGLIPQIEADLYVNPLAGNDENDGISRETSFKTIRKALEMVFADKQRPHTLCLDAGVYSSATNGETFPLTAKSYVKILGDTIGETILDAANTSNVFVINGVTEAELSNLQIINGKAQNGGGIYCNASEIKLNNLIISGNSATNGAGLYIDDYSKIHVSRTEFSHNTATNKGGAIYSFGSDLFCYRVLIDSNKSNSDAFYLMRSEFNIPEFSFINLTIANNTYSTNYGGIRSTDVQTKMIIINSILRTSSSIKIYIPNKSNLVLVNSNIEGGLTGVKGSGTIRYSDQIVDFDPLFVGGTPYDYHLNEASGCIDKGLALFILDDDTLLNLADSEFEGNLPDLGALESPYISAIVIDEEKIPQKFMLFSTYPNPFNSTTTIKYALPKDAMVEITIYDLNGRMVKKLVNERQSCSYRTITWDGTNQSGQIVGSGFYICTMTTPAFIKSRKLVLIK